MMPPRLTDQTALRRNRNRSAGADFLRKEAAEILQERLIEVNREFSAPALVSPFPLDFRNIFEAGLCIRDDEVLDLSPESHDVVIHAMGLHWSNDPLGQIIQCRRALTPDGLFLGVLFGGSTLNELRTCLAEAEVAESGGLSPRVAPMADIKDLGGLLQRSGLALPVADTVAFNVTYRDIFALCRDVRAMGEANALESRLRHPTRRGVFERADQIYRSNFPDADNRIRATFELVFLTGWAPHSSQPEPLKPGSATTSFAVALETVVKPPSTEK